ncbi:MAG: S-layer homology domain-containing protein [Clostridiales bacterium]|nr:S-layer homology domain-containing protein [Clostridiales bacterium]
MKHIKKTGAAVLLCVFFAVSEQHGKIYAMGYNDLSLEEINDLEDSFNAYEAFGEFKSYDNIYHTGYYVVENFEEYNSKAVYFFSEQKTDFIYNTVSHIYDENCIVSKIVSGREYYALYDMDFENEILPFKYKSIEFILKGKFVVIKTTDEEEGHSFYISKKSLETEIEMGNIEESEISYEEAGPLLKIDSLSDISDNAADADKTDTTAIDGLEGYYICCDEDSGLYYITDDEGNKLTKEYIWIDDKVTAENFIYVSVRYGMTGTLTGAVNTEFNEIIPCNFTRLTPVQYGGRICIRAVFADGEPVYYTSYGDEINSDDIDTYLSLDNIACSGWAKQAIADAIKTGIVPERLTTDYTENISREEFCRLAMQTYFIITDSDINDFEMNCPFTDTLSLYISAAYELGIVSGTGEGRFTPDRSITRQEAAVMMTNLIKALDIEKEITAKTKKFNDDNYFSSWAKDSIYFICGDRDNHTSIMQGTRGNNFSPFLAYTREQAISAIYRIY